MAPPSAFDESIRGEKREEKMNQSREDALAEGLYSHVEGEAEKEQTGDQGKKFLVG